MTIGGINVGLVIMMYDGMVKTSSTLPQSPSIVAMGEYVLEGV
jgi:hypothetical protein